MIVRTYWTSLAVARSLTYRLRLLCGLAGFTMIAIGVSAVVLNLVVTYLHGAFYQQWLNELYHLSKPVLGLLLFLHLVPESALSFLTRPLQRRATRHRQREDELLDYLHRKLVQIVPAVELRHEHLRPLRLLIEISDARQVIWSHVGGTAPISPADEAAHVLDLLRANKVIMSTGAHIPPATSNDVRTYNLAVARHLRQLEGTAHGQ